MRNERTVERGGKEGHLAVTVILIWGVRVAVNALVKDNNANLRPTGIPNDIVPTAIILLTALLFKKYIWYTFFSG